MNLNLSRLYRIFLGLGIAILFLTFAYFIGLFALFSAILFFVWGIFLTVIFTVWGWIATFFAGTWIVALAGTIVGWITTFFAWFATTWIGSIFVPVYQLIFPLVAKVAPFFSVGNGSRKLFGIYKKVRQKGQNSLTSIEQQMKVKNMPLAPRMSAVQPSPIIEVSNAVRDLKAKGEKVISFSIGVPGFLPPQHVYDAAEIAAHKENDTGGYLAGRGQPDLIAAFLDRMSKDGLSYEEKNVCVQLGGKGALFNLFQVLVGEGDNVLFPSPYWASYPDMVALAGANSVTIDCPASQDYKMTPEQLDNAITSNTKAFIFNNPSNPTGMLYTPAEVKALAAVLVKHPHVTIISDDIYDKLTYGDTFFHLTQAEPALKDRTVIVQSVSKTYGMPGWRIGMVAAPEYITKALLTVTSQSLTNVAAVPQSAGAAAFGGDHSFLTDVKVGFIERRDIVLNALEQLKDISCPKPEGAFYVFPNIEKCLGKSYNGTVIHTDVDFCKMLLEAEKVACVPGSGFGDEKAIRISYATDIETLKEGLARLTNFVNSLK